MVVAFAYKHAGERHHVGVDVHVGDRAGDVGAGGHSAMDCWGGRSGGQHRLIMACCVPCFGEVGEDV